MIFAICLCLINSGAGILRLNAGDKDSSSMVGKIILFPIGEIEGSVLEALEKDLPAKFHAEVKRQNPMPIPEDAFHPARKQYSSSLILKKLRGLVRSEKQEIALAIANVDLYAEGLNFVFGEAEFGGRCAVISLTRLRQGFYSLPEKKALFTERAIKEAVHELGHVFGIEHCPHPECVMHFSNSLMDTDKKSASFCSRCRGILGDSSHESRH